MRAPLAFAWLASLILVLPVGAADLPEVQVIRPIVREVTDHYDCTGRTVPVEQVELRARVSGYLDKVFFKEGTLVRKGEVLFEIDPRPYQAKMDRTRAAVTMAEARLGLAEADYRRVKSLAAKGVIGPEELDKTQAARETAAAEVHMAQADLKAVRLNLEFTRVVAPIDGRIGRRLLGPGNLVRADETLLATIVSDEPMYASFDIDERTLLHLRRLGNEGTLRNSQTPAFMGLADEQGYPHKGIADFVSNHLDAQTGTIAMRAAFPNPQPAHGERLLMPGMFVRVRLPIGAPYRALLIPEQAIGSNLGHKFVLVVSSNNEIERRWVEVGSSHDRLRVIKSGLKPDDVVILGGARLRPGTAVRTQNKPVPDRRP